MNTTENTRFSADNVLLNTGIKINMPRGYGKTSLALQLSEKLRYPILVSSYHEKDALLERIMKEGWEVSEPIVPKEFDNGYCPYDGKLIVDNIECFDKDVISKYYNRIYAYTTTDEDMREITEILYRPLFS